jgi:hypothetical protein
LLATYHVHVHQEEDLEQQIPFQSFLRDICQKNKQLNRKRYLEKSQSLFSNLDIPFPLNSLYLSLVIFQCLLSRPESLDKNALAQLPPLILITELAKPIILVSPYY